MPLLIARFSCIQRRRTPCTPRMRSVRPPVSSQDPAADACVQRMPMDENLRTGKIVQQVLRIISRRRCQKITPLFLVSFRLRHPDNDTYAGAQEKRPALRDLSNKAGGNFLQPNAGAKVCSFRPSVPGPWSPTHRSSALQPLKSHAPIVDSRSTRANSARSEEPVQRFQNLSVGSGRDIDAHDHKDQMANTEYVNDIFRNLLKDEVSSRCDCDGPVRVSVPTVTIGLAQLAVCSASTRRCRTTRKSKPISTSGCARS